MRLFGGGANFVLKGTTYCGCNTREIGGNAQRMGHQLIVGCLNLHGNVDPAIAYDGHNFIRSRRSILVQ